MPEEVEAMKHGGIMDIIIGCVAVGVMVVFFWPLILLAITALLAVLGWTR